MGETTQNGENKQIELDWETIPNSAMGIYKRMNAAATGIVLKLRFMYHCVTSYSTVRICLKRIIS